MKNDIMIRSTNALQHLKEDRHSLFQLRHFVLEKEYTVQGKMWQCLREIKSRKSSIEALNLEIENVKDNLNLAEIDLEETKSLQDSLQKRTAIIINQINRNITSYQKNIEELEAKRRGLEVELSFFVEAFEKLNALAPVKDIDDYESQKEYWTAKLSNEIAIRSLLGQPLEAEIIKTVLAMPDESSVKREIVSFLNDIKAQKSIEREKNA